MAFAIKAEICDPRAKTFVFTAQKTMYGGKHIAEGDTVFVFASENEGGQGLIARGVVTSAEAIAKKRGIARQTPRVSVSIRRTALAKRPLGRSELRHLTDWNDGQPGTEQDCRHLGRSGGVPQRILLAQPASWGFWIATSGNYFSMCHDPSQPWAGGVL